MAPKLYNPRSILQLNQIPDGTYVGNWFGLTVRFKDNEGVIYECDSKVARRKLNCECWVTVRDGEIKVHTAEPPEPPRPPDRRTRKRQGQSLTTKK